MKTLRFARRLSAEGDEDWTVPAKSERRFVGRSNVPCKPHSVHIVGDARLTVTALILADLCADECERVIPVVDGQIADCRLVDPCEWLTVIVRNPTDAPLSARPMLDTENAWTDGGQAGMTHLVVTHPGEPRPTADYRLPVPPNSTREFVMSPPCACRVVGVTMRSDAPMRLTVDRIEFANISLISDSLPVAYFGGGKRVRTLPLSAANRMGVTLVNDSDEDHWVEIDMDLEPIRKSPEDHQP